MSKAIETLIQYITDIKREIEIAQNLMKLPNFQSQFPSPKKGMHVSPSRPILSNQNIVFPYMLSLYQSQNLENQRQNLENLTALITRFDEIQESSLVLTEERNEYEELQTEATSLVNQAKTLLNSLQEKQISKKVVGVTLPETPVSGAESPVKKPEKEDERRVEVTPDSLAPVSGTENPFDNLENGTEVETTQHPLAPVSKTEGPVNKLDDTPRNEITQQPPVSVSRTESPLDKENESGAAATQHPLLPVSRGTDDPVEEKTRRTNMLLNLNTASVQFKAAIDKLPKQGKAYQAGNTLIEALDGYKKGFVEQTIDLETFKNSCMPEIDDALKSELATLPFLTKLLYDIRLCIARILAPIASVATGHRPGFFTARDTRPTTEAAQRLETMKTNIATMTMG